jgi:hypothetical protein
MRLNCADARVDRAGRDLHEAMVQHQSVCLRQLGAGRANEVRYGRAESVRWIDSIVRARQRLEQADRMTVVADRESDIYEMWARLPDARTHLLIRACRDRAVQLSDGPGTLFEWLEGLPEQGRYALELAAVANKRSAHQALMQVRWPPVEILRPRQKSAPKDDAASVALWAIEVREDASTVVGTEQPICWRLLTTHAIQDMADAMQCVHWYRQRWHIEQMFRTLKTQALDIESSLLEEAPRLEKLAILASSAAVKTIQLTLARKDHSNHRPATDCFATSEHAFLQQVGATLEGKTLKQKNPHTPLSLAWAAWIVARLGGWKGYASERPPGPITMIHGLQALSRIRYGWQLAREIG